MELQNAIKNVLAELEDALLKMSHEQYNARSKHLFNTSIGQHVRHIIELFQSLFHGYPDGIVNYDRRKRDLAIETDKNLAIAIMNRIINNLDKPAKYLILETNFGLENENITIESNFTRELAYNLEHTIHHMALIKVGINELTHIVVSEKFGVAPSTIKHRTECAQ